MKIEDLDLKATAPSQHQHLFLQLGISPISCCLAEAKARGDEDECVEPGFSKEVMSQSEAQEPKVEIGHLQSLKPCARTALEMAAHESESDFDIDIDADDLIPGL